MIKDKNATIGYHCPQCGISILNTVNMFSFSTAGNLIKLKCPCGASELVINITREKKFRLTVPCIVCPNSHSYTISPHIFFEREIFSFSCKFTALNICFIGKSHKAVNGALKKNEQELLETFAEYDDNFDSEMTELSDIFNWDDEFDDDDFDDFDEEEWFDELFGDFEGGNGFAGIEELLGISKTPGFELYKNEDLGGDDGFDLELYSGFSTYSADVSEELGKQEADLDNIKAKIKHYPVITQVLDAISGLVKNKKIFCKCNNFDGSISLLENCVRISCKNCGSERDIKSADISDAEYITGMNELFLDFED